MRTALALPLLGVAALALAGCAPADHVLPPGSSASGQPGVPDSSETGTPPADPVNESVGINCQQLLNDQTVYDWGSGNFAYDASYAPAAGSSAATAVASGGLACRWINLTSSETVDFAVSVPASDDARTAAAAAGSPAPELAPDAYFSSDGTTGHLDIFSGKYWITGESTWFLSPEDAAPLASAAIAALG